MDCRQVAAWLAAPDGPRRPALDDHLRACAGCRRLTGAFARLDAAVARLLLVAPAEPLRRHLAALVAAEGSPAPSVPASAADAALRQALVSQPPAYLQAQLMALADEAVVAQSQAAEQARARADAALHAALVIGPPSELQARLTTLAGDAIAARSNALARAPESTHVRVDAAVRAAVVSEPPAELQERVMALANEAALGRLDVALRAAVVTEAPAEVRARLAALAPAAPAEGWAQRLWAVVRARPAVYAGQLATLAVLAYAVVQVAAWLGSLPVVLGNVPYAFELLLLSPAMDYLGQIEAVVQQLGLWLLVAAAGWVLAQGLSWQRNREPAP